MLSHDDIYWCLEDYLLQGKRERLRFLTPDEVPEEFRYVPKSRLYRGIQIRRERLGTDIRHDDGYFSFTTSQSMAKEFARGLMGNDYRRGDNIGIVFSHRPVIDDVVINVGTFLRRYKTVKLGGMAGENETILRTDGIIVNKSNIISTVKAF